MDASDPYVVLGIARDADARAVKRAFRALARKLHPDVSADPGDVNRFRAAREACEMLLDPARRREVDRRLAERERMRADPFGAVGDAIVEGLRRAFDDVMEHVEPRGAGAWAGPRERPGWSAEERVAAGAGRASSRNALRAGGAQRLEGRVSGSGRVDVDAYLSRAEARRGVYLPFRFHLGPRTIDTEIAIPPGVRRGDRLVYRVPVGGTDPADLTFVVHIDCEP